MESLTSKSFDLPSSGISLRRILSGIAEEEVAVGFGDSLDYRARVTGFAKGSTRDKIDQSDVLSEALQRYDAAVPTLGFHSLHDYQTLILRAFERHWQHQNEVGEPA